MLQRPNACQFLTYLNLVPNFLSDPHKVLYEEMALSRDLMNPSLPLSVVSNFLSCILYLNFSLVVPKYPDLGPQHLGVLERYQARDFSCKT